jgi:chitinase
MRGYKMPEKAMLYQVGTICLLALLILSTPSGLDAQQSMYVTGYWPTWAYPMTPEAATWTGLTHVIHFSASPVTTAPYLNVLVNPVDSLGMENNGSDVGQVGRLIRIAHSHGVKALLSLGGIYGTQAGNMNFICADSARTDIFATASVAYAKRRGYDGVEVDWEPPANRNDNMRLLRLLRRELNKGMTSVSRGILICACADGAMDRWDPVWCNQNVDQLNTMDYDYWQLGSGICFGCDADRAGFNAALHRPGSSFGQVMYNNQANYDANEIVSGSSISNPKHGPRAFLKAGFDPAKLAAGLPFYGYVFNNVTGPGQLRNGANNDYTTYAAILAAYATGGLTYHWDDSCKVPYMTGTPASNAWPFNRGKPVFVTFDDTLSIRLKTEWAKQLGLGGIMCYDLSMGWIDNASVKDPLLRSVVKAINSIPNLTIQVVSPSTGDSVSGTIPISVNTGSAVTKVDFIVNGQTIYTGTAPPFSAVWSTAGLTGPQTISAKAYDAAGNSVFSAPVTVFIRVPSVKKPSSKVEGQLFFDQTGNGIFEPLLGEIPLAGWPVLLNDSALTLSLDDGSFEFDSLTAGTYSLAVTPPQAGWTATIPTSAARTVTLASDTSSITGQTFGFISPYPILRLQKGWNLISLPVSLSDRSVQHVFPTATSSLYTGNTVKVDSLAYGHGYWLKFGYAQTMVLAGTPLRVASMQVAPGWNIVGSLGYPISSALVKALNTDIGVSGIWGFDGRYINADTLIPSEGYWVKIDTAGTLILMLPGANQTALASAQAPAITGNTLTLRTANGTTQTLNFSRLSPGTDNIRMFDLPPLPPQGGFDARFPGYPGSTEGSLYAFINSSQTLPINLHSAVYPLTLSWSVTDGSGYTLKMADGTTLSISGTQSATVAAGSGADDERLLLSSADNSTAGRPEGFRLEQNFPNPFNPSTSIGIAIPERGTLHAAVYNILGERVVLLANGAVEAGHMFLRFDASSANLPSGVYYCRATLEIAGKGIQTSGIRMILSR